MRRFGIALTTSLFLLAGMAMPVTAQDPVCGAPGQEVPATIVGAGAIPQVDASVSAQNRMSFFSVHSVVL